MIGSSRSAILKSKPSTGEEAEEPELALRGLQWGFEFEWGAWIRWNWHQGVEDVDSNQGRAATSRQGIMRVLAYYEVILTENKRSLSHQTSLLDYFQSCSRILAFPVCCCTLKMIIHGTLLRFERKCQLLKLFSVRSYSMWFISEVWIHIFSVKTHCLEPAPPQFNIALFCLD